MYFKLKRNIPLIYLLTALNYSWFWIAVWVLYYLKFTNYAGIGLLESIMITTAVLGEIPTGAIGDLLGKKKTMMLAFVCAGFGNMIMGFAPSFSLLGIGLLFVSLGYTFESGTVHALVYDSLKSIKKEATFDKVLSNISSVRMTTMGVVSIIGGYLYTIYPGLPFIVLGLCQVIGIGVCFLLTEPKIDTVTFSMRNYLLQTKTGFQQLFKNSKIRLQSIMIIALTTIIVINGQILIETQLVGQGYSPQQLGVIIAIMFLLSAAIGQLTPLVSRWLGRWGGFILISLIIALTMVIIPLVGIVLGTIIIMSRNGLIELFGNSASVMINETTESKYRATTLSTYSMLSNIPYVLTAYGIGYAIDVWNVHSVTALLGIILMILTVLSFVYRPQSPAA
ncbi:MAG: MFS transporter [bacterium]|nr:MFS transporter [bacterium]